MLHAATDIVPISPILTRDACYPVPSSSNLLEQYKIIPGNGLISTFKSTAISIVLTEKFAVAPKDQNSARCALAKCLKKLANVLRARITKSENSFGTRATEFSDLVIRCPA